MPGDEDWCIRNRAFNANNNFAFALWKERAPQSSPPIQISAALLVCVKLRSDYKWSTAGCRGSETQGPQVSFLFLFFLQKKNNQELPSRAVHLPCFLSFCCCWVTFSGHCSNCCSVLCLWSLKAPGLGCHPFSCCCAFDKGFRLSDPFSPNFKMDKNVTWLHENLKMPQC